MASQVQLDVRPWTSLIACLFGHSERAEQVSKAPGSRNRRSADDKDPEASSKQQSIKTAAVYAAAAEQSIKPAAACSDKITAYTKAACLQSTDTASTPSPSSLIDDSRVCMTTAFPLEASVDTVLDGNIKSAQAMFMRYDMDLDSRLNQQDYYDLMLELNLALPVQDYQQLVNDIFLYADTDQDGLISTDDFGALYKAIAAAREAFRHQDHHRNGLIDRYDFTQMLADLDVDDGEQGPQVLADKAFSLADSSSRGILNFGQVLLWYGSYLAAIGRQDSPEPSSNRAITEEYGLKPLLG